MGIPGMLASSNSSISNPHARARLSHSAVMSPSAPIVSPSFVCNDCGRSYRTKDSLTRHRHNHDESNLHICSTCSLTFNRSDVLSRHVRIHHRGRKRSPRACISCKVAKIKCDAGTPCARCAASSQTCKYETDSNHERHREQIAARQRGLRQRTASSEDSTTVPLNNMSGTTKAHVRVSEPLGVREMKQKLRTNAHIISSASSVSSDLTSYLASPVLAIPDADRLDMPANRLGAVLPGAICASSGVQPLGTPAHENCGTSRLETQVDATDGVFNSKWWSNNTNPWIQSTELVPWHSLDPFHQVADINNGNQFLDVNVNAFNQQHNTVYENLQDFNAIDSALCTPIYPADNNNVSMISNTQQVDYGKVVPNLMSTHLSHFNEFLTQPAWPHPNTVNYIRAMENSYRKYVAPPDLVVPQSN